MPTANEQRSDQTRRLDSIEKKLDAMGEAIISLARAEEKIHTITEFGKQQSAQLSTLINRVDKLEELVRQNASTVNIINKIFWVVIAAAATGITGMLFIQ